MLKSIFGRNSTADSLMIDLLQVKTKMFWVVSLSPFRILEVESFWHFCILDLGPGCKNAKTVFGGNSAEDSPMYFC